MDKIKAIAEKQEKLQALLASRPKANCSSKYSKDSDVKREMEIEQLQEEIRKLQE